MLQYSISVVRRRNRNHHEATLTTSSFLLIISKKTTSKQRTKIKQGVPTAAHLLFFSVLRPSPNHSLLSLPAAVKEIAKVAVPIMR